MPEMQAEVRVSKEEARELLRQIGHIQAELDGLARWVMEMIIGEDDGEGKLQ